jgi:hypothetical protein
MENIASAIVDFNFSTLMCEMCRLPKYMFINDSIRQATPSDWRNVPEYWEQWISFARTRYKECNLNNIPLDVLKQFKIEELSDACTVDILNGFHSTAYNDEDKFFPFDEKDQLNMTGMLIFAIVVTLSFLTLIVNVPFYWKAKNELISYEWTPTQIIKLCVDAYMAKITKMRFYHELRYMVNQATTATEVMEIHW